MANWTDDEIREALTYDPVSHAEKLAGKRWDEWGPGVNRNALEAMDLAGRSADAKRTILSQTGDTHYGMSVHVYAAVVREMGFQDALRVDFTDLHDGSPEALLVFWHPSQGMLLAFDTFHGNVNGGNVYYNWRPNPLVERWNFTSSGSWREPGVWCGYHDCREALRFNMRRLAENGQFVSPWVRRPFLWLCHHGDKDSDGRINDSKRVNAERIAMLPEAVLAAITPPENHN